MMNNQNNRLSNLAIALAAGIFVTSLSGCASLFGNRNCHCTHPGPCVCCSDSTYQKKVVGVKQLPSKTSATDKAHLAELLNTDYSLKEYLPEVPKRMVWIDDSVNTTESELLPNFSVVGKRVMPRDVTMDNTENAVYFYFNNAADGTPEPLRLRVQYYADDPLNYKKLLFNIDGFDYEFTPTNFQRGKGRGIMIWENSDDPLRAADKDLIYALSHCNWCQMRLIGSDGMQHVKMISESQKADFLRTLQLYRLKGGKFE